MDLCKFEEVFVVRCMNGWMDKCKFEIVFYGKSDVWMDG